MVAKRVKAQGKQVQVILTRSGKKNTRQLERLYGDKIDDDTQTQNSHKVVKITNRILTRKSQVTRSQQLKIDYQVDPESLRNKKRISKVSKLSF